MYQHNSKNTLTQFESNIIAEPFAFVGEITRDAIEQAIGEDFHQIIQKSTVIKHLQKIPLFSFLPFSRLEWISEAFCKQRYNHNETIATAE